MIDKSSWLRSIAIVMLASVLASCASNPSNGAETTGTAVVEEIQYIVKPGDRLVDIARTLTGRSGNWQSIANHNDIKNPDLLVVGDVLRIPVALSRNYAANTGRAAVVSLPATAATATIPTNLVQSDDNNVATQRRQRITDEVGDDVVVAPVDINRTFNLEPIDADLSAERIIEQTSRIDDINLPKIRVVGSYYPKGIYQQPANYSQLILRASPGALFTLEMEVNDWYKIRTANGIGYIRKTDGAILDSQ